MAAHSLYALTQSLEGPDQQVESGVKLPHAAANLNRKSKAADDFLNTLALVDIAKRYTVEKMSLRSLSSMSRDLFYNGYISFQDHVLLSFQPQQNESHDASHGLDSELIDQSTNFVSHWKVQLQLHQQLGDTRSAAKDKRALNILENLSALASR